MKILIIAQLLKSVSYLLLIYGIWMICSTSIISMFRKTYFTRFRVSKDQLVRGRLFRHIHLLVTLTFEGKGMFFICSFIVLSISLFLVIFILLINGTSIGTAIVISVVFGMAPYLYLKIRLNTIRTEGSFEADLIVGELLNQYKMNYFNMIEAIDRLVSFKEAPICRRAFYRLSIQLKDYKTEEELKGALKDMVFVINTDWMKMLANNIYLAIECHVNVSIGLEDILQELKEAKTALEKAKQINLEGFSILKYFSPLMYLFTVLISIKYFGFSVKKFFAYQFHTEIGIKFFILILLLMLVNIGCMKVFENQKFDL